MAATNNPSHPQKDTEIVLEYLEKFPEAPSKTLARKIYSENNFLKSFESVYGKVRYYRGQYGVQHRKDLKDKKLSGFNFICTNFKEVPGFAVVTLKTNHRDPIVEQILEIYKAHD